MCLWWAGICTFQCIFKMDESESLCLCSTNTLRVFELVRVREGAHCHVTESVCWDVCVVTKFREHV